MTAKEVQYALTYSQYSPFFYRSHYVVPNVFWGLDFNHELDLLSISKQGLIGTEIEIKVSKSDLKRDREKRHGHYDSRIGQLYFAGPQELEEAFFEYAPKEAGIITVYNDPKNTWVHRIYQCTIRRRPKRRKTYYKFTEKEILKLLHLGTMRYWSLFSKQFKPTERRVEMTRRYIVFLDEDSGVYWKTPEFNGDKEEMEKFSSSDSCDKNWPEIIKEFEGVDTLHKLIGASNTAQRFYHSCFGFGHVLPIQKTGFSHIGAHEMGKNLWLVEY